MKLRITILKYHSWYLCQISLQIMLLLILIWLINEGTIKNCHGELGSIIKYYYYLYHDYDDDYGDGDDA